MGNSAGANLLLAVLLHLSHPNPDVPPLNLKDDEQLAAAVAISPWCNLDTAAKSMTTNANKDVLAASALEYWGGNFLSSRPLDPWNSPLQAPADWWSELKVGEILMIYGEDEIMKDDTEILCKRVQVCADPFLIYDNNIDTKLSDIVGPSANDCVRHARRRP
jgi:acetyl esterase/lipase